MAKITDKKRFKTEALQRGTGFFPRTAVSFEISTPTHTLKVEGSKKQFPTTMANHNLQTKTITVVISPEHKLHQSISTLYQPLQQREIQQIWGDWSPNSHRHRQIKYKASRMTHGKLHFPLQWSIQGTCTHLLKHNITMLPTHIYKHCVTPEKRNLHGFQIRKNLLIA